MRIQRLFFALTAVNFMLLLFLLAQLRPVEASSDSPVLRGRGLEIVDDRGRVRASVKLHPADDKFRMPDGSTGYPETVVLRLINPDGRPGVKIAASARGAGIVVIGEADATHSALSADGVESRLRLKEKDGREMVIKP